MNDDEKGPPTDQATWALADWRRDPNNPARLRGYQSHLVKPEMNPDKVSVDRPILIIFVDGSRLEWDGEKWVALSAGQSRNSPRLGHQTGSSEAESTLTVESRHAIITYLTKWVVGLVLAIGALTAFVVVEIKSYAETVTKASVANALDEASADIRKERDAARDAARNALEVSTSARENAKRALDTANTAAETGIELEKALADARAQKDKAVKVVVSLEGDLGDAKKAKEFIDSLRGEYDKLAPGIAKDEGFREAMARRLPNVPPGTIVAFAGSGAAPDGWELCDGRLIDSQREDGKYKQIILAIGRTWGDGGDPTSWDQPEVAGRPRKANLPDLRGMFLRGADMGRNIDPRRELGTNQEDSTRLPRTPFVLAREEGFWFALTPKAHPASEIQAAPVVMTSGTGIASAKVAAAAVSGGDEETRPTNAAVNWIIKY